MDAGRATCGLVAASAAQLGLAAAGLAIALRRGHSYDIPLLHGDPARILRESVVMGTAFSQPPVMMAAQAVLTAAVARRGDPRAVRGLQVLGSAMVAGYLAERLVRTRLRRRGWDPVETPLALAGLWLSAAMVVLGGRPRRNLYQLRPTDSSGRAASVWKTTQ